MKTVHRTDFSDSRKMGKITDGSVDLIVTSPPYPMIEMWDSVFMDMNPKIGRVLKKDKGMDAFEMMHRELDSVWKESFRVLKNGGFACINIGDATRNLNNNFSLYSNHSRIIRSMVETGFTALPSVLWRKPTNSPTKFMGSGVLPAGAYVTLEHEHILIFRKGSKREFKTPEEKSHRRESSLFWEERNIWFSDIWTNIKGASQKLKNGDSRKRSAAFPLEIAYRLINMYSLKGDLVLDPFSGTGTTNLASLISARNSIGFEIDKTLKEIIDAALEGLIEKAEEVIEGRLENHRLFVSKRKENGGSFKHKNIRYKFPVVTAQEKDLYLNKPVGVKIKSDGNFIITYR